MLRTMCRTLPVVVFVLLASRGVAVAQFDVPVKKDPVELAFTLPKGMSFTPAEAKAAIAFRNRVEPHLRSALERVQMAEGTAAKREAARDVYEIRAEIKAYVNHVIHVRQQKYMAEMARRAEAARKAAAKRAAQQRKKGKGKKKKRR